jgi:hypothetical protein
LEKERFSAGTAFPPNLPAFFANSGLLNARLAGETLLPPMLAISRCLSGLMAAKPRLLFGWLAMRHSPEASLE